MVKQDIKRLVEEMTLEEKASLCSGADFWHTKAIDRLNIPQSKVADGPHGLRLQEESQDHLGQNQSKEAVCFPTGATVASSFDKGLVKRMGETIGKEAQAEGISVVLGPAINIKRSPLGGRNFEYMSEDPLLTTQLAEAYIKGIQSQDVGTSVKHFVANNQETRRNTVSADVDERTLREIYLAAFEGAVSKAKPWSVMTSYNLVNGKYVSEDEELVSKILRDEWGFDGYTVSDWGGVNDRVPALDAGLDLEMPGPSAENDSFIVEAVKKGELSEEKLNQAVERILTIIYLYEENKRKEIFDLDKDHKISQEIAQESIVLLKNEENTLPLTNLEHVAFVGTYAENPRYQGGGSSHIHSAKITSALDAVKESGQVTFAKGFNDNTEKIDDKLKEEAINVAQNSDHVVIFAGLPESFESEGYDRKHMKLPENQNDLIREISKVNQNVTVVLHNGSPVEMPWIKDVKAVIEAYLGGEAIGASVVNVLLGKVNPSGRLAETFPVKLEDNPSYLNFPGEGDTVEHREGVFVGYRYYVSKKMDVLFPFGHGLSYTTFKYDNLTVDKDGLTDEDTLTVSVEVTNIGNIAGKEVVQLYVSPKESKVIRPIRELKAFDKVHLEAGETKIVQFELGKRAFAYWNTEIHDWHVETGEFDIEIAKNAHEVVINKIVKVESTVTIPKTFTWNSTLGDIMSDPKGQQVFGGFMQQAMGGEETEQLQQPDDAVSSEMMQAIQDAMPLRGLVSFVPELSREMLQPILDALNN